VFAGQPALAAESEDVLLTILVSGLLQESDEPINIRRATVRVENSDFQDERPTDAKGKVVFKLPTGSVKIVVTGQDTERHWATGSCSVEVTEDMVVGVRLDLKEVTRDCEFPDAG